MITHQRLLEVVQYDKSTGIFTTKITRRGSPAKSIIGSIGKRGYLNVVIDYKYYSLHRLAWFYVTGKWPIDQIDHIDRNKCNNKWENLREATGSENSRNIGISSRNTSGIKGVHWNESHKRWCAKVHLHSKRHHIGYFKNIEDAQKAVSKKRNELHGIFANQGHT